MPQISSSGQEGPELNTCFHTAFEDPTVPLSSSQLAGGELAVPGASQRRASAERRVPCARVAAAPEQAIRAAAQPDKRACWGPCSAY